jgi:hypothetical protein
MGANAQTSVPTFTAGQVLTAAQMNDSARTGVPVFADSSARDAAFGGTGEKTLAEGQLCYLEDSNVVQYYDSASWATVGPTTAGGLIYITGATFTSVQNVNLPTSTFTSTYRNYRVLFFRQTVSGTIAQTVRMRASGSDDTNATYNLGAWGTRINAAAATNYSNDSATSWSFQDAVSAKDQFVVMDVMNPQETAETNIAGHHFAAPGGTYYFYGFAGNFDNTTSFDAMSFNLASGTSSGYYRVYAYSES